MLFDLPADLEPDLTINPIAAAETRTEMLGGPNSGELRVKLLHPDARPPAVSFAGSDLGYDVFAIEDVVLEPGVPVKLRTGISIEGPPGWGFVLGDRSSMAAKGITYAGGRIDAGYRGEILVCLINVNQPVISLSLERGPGGHITNASLVRSDVSVPVRKGDKIIQLSPFQSLTRSPILVVDELSTSDRGSGGFGSTGR